MQELDVQFIEERFGATAPRSRSRPSWFVLLGIAAAAVFFALQQDQDSADAWTWLVLLPWILVLWILFIGWLEARRQRNRRRDINRAWQNVQLENWEEARSALEAPMQKPIMSPSDRCQAFMLLAGIAEQARQFDPAVKIYETLLIERVGDGFQLQEVQLALAAAKIRNEELTDGVRLLNRLERVTMPASLQAVFQLVRLYQQVFMGQLEDAVDGLADRRSLFRRHLSTKAGYGYGLLAAAMHHLKRNEEATGLWRDATTLVPADKLVAEYSLLVPVSANYRSVEHPV